jgi:hypothetical protein
MSLAAVAYVALLSEEPPQGQRADFLDVEKIVEKVALQASDAGLWINGAGRISVTLQKLEGAGALHRVSVECGPGFLGQQVLASRVFRA